MIRAHVFWVAGTWPGRLGIVLRPRGGDWLEDEAKSWREAGVDLVVSLLEPDEEAQLGLQGEAAAAAASGVAFRVFPIPDRGVPVSRDSVAQLTSDLVDALSEGRNVAVHCRQGIGRSSLIVGSVLVASGTVLAEALRAIKESRGLEVPETDQQRQWLDDFASWVESARAAHQAAAADERRRGVHSNSRLS